jgi:hypothetical protein
LTFFCFNFTVWRQKMLVLKTLTQILPNITVAFIQTNQYC